MRVRAFHHSGSGAIRAKAGEVRVWLYQTYSSLLTGKNREYIVHSICPSGDGTVPMTQDLLSVFDIASRLNLHVKTVRSYVRDGRLKAIRIGKSYRILRSDLEAFTGHPLPPSESEVARRQRHVEVSSVMQIDAISSDAASRLDSALTAYVHGNSRGNEPLRVESIYDRDIGRLKIILLGGANGTAGALRFITALLEE